MTIRVTSTTQYLRVSNTGAVTMVLAGPAGPAGSGGGGGASDWGDIGGTLSDQTDLQDELDGKSDTGHGHAISDVTGLQTALDGKSPTSHDHTGVYQPLDADLTALAAANNSATLAATTAAFTSADETKLDGIEAGAEVNDSAAEILAKLVTVDGSGSGLDADLLDGQSSAAFATAGHDHTGTYQPLDSDLTALATAFAAAGASGPATLAFNEDTDNGSNKVTVSAPASLSGDVVATLPSATGLLVLGTGGSGGNAAGLWIGTAAEYAGLTPSSTTVYVVTP